MKQMSKILFSCLLIGLLSCGVLAQDAKKPAGKAKPAPKATKFLGKGDGITTCPVSGEAFTTKDHHGEFYGRTVYFCCADCLAAAQKSPAAYVKKTEAAQKAAVAAAKPAAKAESHDHGAMNHDGAAAKFLGKGDGVETCPVTGEPVDKKLKGEALGRTFYVCCEGCLATVKKNPEAYLKPAAAKKETAFLGKGDGVETCPVTGEPVNKSLTGEVNGQKFAVCCAGCLETVKANPAAYLKKASH